MGRLLIACTVWLTLAPAAQAFIAQNGQRVESDRPGSFTVPYTSLSSPRAFWCAAGDYAIRVLRVPKDTRIYRTTAPPRRSGEGMSFSFDRSQATASGLPRLSRSRGLSAADARFQCNLPSANP